MNNNLLQTKDFFHFVESRFANLELKNVVMGIAVPSIHILPAINLANKIQIAAQNVYFEDSGAFTGEISVDMLKQVGLKYCIVGHSERRQIFGESNIDINKKITKLLKNSISPIFCIGETEKQYNAGETSKICQLQIEKGLAGITKNMIGNIIIAYEPIWAIGTGKTATPEIAQKTIKIIREKICEIYSNDIGAKIPIIYGGSVKPNNIKQIMLQPDIDGVLVGGASVDANSYIKLYENK